MGRPKSWIELWGLCFIGLVMPAYVISRDYTCDPHGRRNCQFFSADLLWFSFPLPPLESHSMKMGSLHTSPNL